MSRLLHKIRKLGIDEIRVRGSQSLNSLAERRGWSSLNKLPADGAFELLLSESFRTDEDLLTHFRTRKGPTFFAGLGDRTRSISEFKRQWPAAEREILENADRILSGQFDLLGYFGLSFGDPIDWHLEPLAAKSAPLIHWSSLDYLNAESVGDKKIIWELNRHQYFGLLGMAYWLTSDEKYAEVFKNHLLAWMDQNPPKKGINWASSLEIALRSISWLWAFQFFKDTPALDSDTFKRALKFLYLNARHLETYLSTYFSPNTHLTGEALGLFYLGTMLPEFREASRWKQKGRKILLDQLEFHVKPDGVYFEQTSYYHRYTADFYTHFSILSRLNGEHLLKDVDSALQALLDHMMFVTRPDGTTSFWGDDDGGRLLKLDRRPPNDFRSALSTGALLFERGDYKFVAGELAEESFWLLGPESAAEFDQLKASAPAKLSMGFSDGGYYVMRDGWSKDANYLFFDCGPHGTLNCGHAHADALSFDLAANGSTVLIDPGTFTYTGSQELRDWFRSSTAHNTLTLDGESSSVPLGPFSWKSIANCRTSKWLTTNRFDFISGSHDGYQRLNKPAGQSREIFFLKNGYWILRDQITSEGIHNADLWFHFSSNAAPVIEAPDHDTTAVVTRDELGELSICVFAKDGRWRREDGWASNCYGEKSPARVYAYSLRLNGNEEILTFLLPRKSATSKTPQIRQVEAIGGKAFEISHDNGFDVVMIRDKSGSLVEMERLSSDSEWLWARFSSPEELVPDELIILDGANLDLAGRKILAAERNLDYLVAKRSGDHFKVETSTGDFDCLLPLSGFEVKGAGLKPV